MIEDYANRWYMIEDNYMRKDHINRQHMIWNFNTKDYGKGHHMG